MTESGVATSAVPIWVDMAATDLPKIQQFYGGLFGWEVQDLGPDAGGYAMFALNGKVVAGIGPKQMEGQPTAWAVYIGTDDADAVAQRVSANGGTVVAPPFDVLGQGRMAVFQDSVGAFICVWQPIAMHGFEVHNEPGSFDWAELNARGWEKAAGFYKAVFGWGMKSNPMGDDMVYNEFLLNDRSISGGMEMNPGIPAQVPSYWMPYFKVSDLDASHAKVSELGGSSMMPPSPFPGGRFSIVTDPEGATFGLMSNK